MRSLRPACLLLYAYAYKDQYTDVFITFSHRCSSNRREAPRAAEHGQAHRARPDGEASEEETTDTG